MADDAMSALDVKTSVSWQRQIDRMSCQLCLQVVQAADSDDTRDLFTNLYLYAMPHFEAYLIGCQRQTEAKAISWLDGCQWFTIGLCCAGFWLHNNNDPARQGASQQMLRRCLQSLTSAAHCFEGQGAMRDSLWQVHDAAYALGNGVHPDVDRILGQARAGGFHVPRRDERLLRSAMSTSVS